MQTLPISEAAWQDITIDFIIVFRRHKVHLLYLLWWTDYLNWLILVHSLPLSQHPKWLNFFISIVVRHHEFPQSIVYDCDPVFVSNFWRKLFELSGTKLGMSSAYHPQADGKFEVVNKGLEKYLRAFTQHKPSTYVSLLPWVESNYNTSYHIKMKMSPFEVFYGRKSSSYTMGVYL